MDKGPIIGIVKFRTAGRKDLISKGKYAQSWANRIDLQIRNSSYRSGFYLRSNLTPFDAAYRLLFEARAGSVGKEMAARFAVCLAQLKTQQTTFRELTIKNFIEMEKAREVVEG